MTPLGLRGPAWLALVVVVAACDKAPARPAAIPPPNTPSSPATVTDFQIDVPRNVAPGSSVQLKATATKSDGSIEDITEKTEWKTSNERVLKISPQGVATAHERGFVTVWAWFNRQRAASVAVLPDNTYAVWARVRDGGLELPGVTVQVISGIGEGLRAVSDEKGDFFLFGVSGRIEFKAEKPGFRNERRQITVTGHQQMPDLGMVFEGTRAALAGEYTMTLTRGCANATLPATRSYRATIQQNGSALSVQLGEADFVVNNGLGDRFTGSIASDGRVAFEIGQWDFYYYYPIGPFHLVERFSNSQSLLVNGLVRGQVSAEGISGSMMGMIALSSKFAEPFHPYTSYCAETWHPFEMRRR